MSLLIDPGAQDMNLQVNHVSFGYTFTPVLHDITFNVPRGEFLCILGPNGSGKSTLLKLIIGTLTPSAGTILLDGNTMTAFSRTDLARRIAYVPQESSWAFPVPVREVVLMGRAPFTGTLGFESTEDHEIAEKAMQMVDVAALADHPINAISGGERQRALLARALAQQPEVLILDEPNIHLDLSHQLEVFTILRTLNRDRGLSIICVSHDINLASSFCKMIVLLAPEGTRGSKVFAVGSPNDVITGTYLKAVFSTSVLVDRHPKTGAPRVTLDPE